jgi:uncharacterized protein YdcH (DUF465 family)
MFEHEKIIVDTLLTENNDFKRLYSKHHVLNSKVDDANHGSTPLDEYALENLKKEKLLLKDQMAGIIRDYRRAHA